MLANLDIGIGYIFQEAEGYGISEESDTGEIEGGGRARDAWADRTRKTNIAIQMMCCDGIGWAV
jgi:hypothetical protein